MKDELKRLIISTHNVPLFTIGTSTRKIIDSAEVIAQNLLENGVVVIDTDVVSSRNRPLITECFGRPLNEILDQFRTLKNEKEALVTMYKSLQNELNEKVAELDRFKEIETTVNSFWSELQKITTFKKKSEPTLEELLEYMENLKAEVINELAHRAENRIATNTDISNAQYQSIIFEISEACKEMVGEG